MARFTRWMMSPRKSRAVSLSHVRLAVAYRQAYPEEIETRLHAEERWTPERVWQTYPFTRPPRR